MPGYTDIMKIYMSLQPVTIHSGVIQLNSEQAKSRMHNLSHIADDRFDVVRPINFKTGELFGYEGQLPKSMVSSIEDDSDAAVKPKKHKKSDV